jgi:outer membrane lipoprotein-sorting protein
MGRSAMAALAMLLGAGVGSAQQQPQDIVKKAIEAHGGVETLKKFPAGTSKIAGKVNIEGNEFPFTGTLAFAIPGRIRLEMALEVAGQKASLVQIVNGDKTYQTENGVPTRLTPEMQAELRESAVIQEVSLLYPLLDPEKYTLAAEKDTRIDGKDAAVVLVKSKGLKDSRLYFDKATGLLLAMQREGLSPGQKKVDELTVFSNFKKVEGMVAPMTSRVTHDAKPFLAIGVVEYKPAAKVDDNLFKIE